MLTEKRIADDPDMCQHSAALRWVNNLIIDLKNQLLGCVCTEPITIKRLDAWRQHYQDLEQCRTPDRIH